MMSGEIHNRIEVVSIKNNDDDNTNKTIIDEGGKSATCEDGYNYPLCCTICNIKVTSTKILQRHLEGRKHKMRVERKGKSFVCELCDLTANSETQLNIHLSSSRHRAKLQRKEYNEFTAIATSLKGAWIIIVCLICLFLNLFLLFKLI
ncbi:hypothetical protein NQ315_008184, partial [Exocentrus adspersus]